MNKSELDHVWHSVTSVLENEFRTRGWLSPQAARIEALEAALREIALVVIMLQSNMQGSSLAPPSDQDEEWTSVFGLM